MQGAAKTSGWPDTYWWIAALTIAVALGFPFFLVDVPPVLDYPNHLARYFVLAHPNDPILSRMYQPQWKILPNIGMDVLGVALLKIADVHVGGRILLACSLFVPIIGVVTYSRVVFGRFLYWPLASALIAYNGIFFLGFLNFELSLGLAFAAAALWIAVRDRSVVWTTVLGAAMAAVIFFCHILGVGLFALLIGSWEFGRLLDLQRRNKLDGREVLQTGVMLGLALSSSLILYLACPLSETSSSIGSWSGSEKLAALFVPFMDYHLHTTTVIGVFFIAFLILARRHLHVAQGTVLALLILAVMFVAAPSSIKSGTFVNPRLTLMMALLLFAGMQLRLRPRVGLYVGLIFAAVIGFRALNVALDWVDHRRDLADLRSAIANVPPGSRVMVARGHAGHEVETKVPTRAIQGGQRVDGHVAGLLVIERHAFWPLMFASPTQQPIAVRAPYDRIANPLGDPVVWRVLRQEPLAAKILAAVPYLQNWRANFDNVLLIDPPEFINPPPGLVEVYRGDFAVLYRIDPSIH